MITYKLAKQLKDAGFPQTGMGIFRFSDRVENMPISGNRFKEEWKEKSTYIPILSELIDACYKSAKSGIAACFKLEEVVGYWCAEIYCDRKKYRAGGMFKNITEFMETPEEVVANLWLKLNKNN